MSESQSDLQDISLDSENGEFDEEAEPPDKFDNENGYKETKVQALLVWKRQRHCWCRSVCGGRVDRESFWGAESLRQNHLSEAYSWPACGYLSVCVCPTEWSKDLFFDQLHAVTARIPASEFLIPYGDWNSHVGHAGTGYREVHGGMGYGRPEPDVEGTP